MVTLGGTVVAGAVWEGADVVGVYQSAGVSGDIVAVALTGDYTLTKEAGVAFTQGDKLYWDATNDNLDKTNTNIPAGIASGAAASGDVLADVILGTF